MFFTKTIIGIFCDVHEFHLVFERFRTGKVLSQTIDKRRLKPCGLCNSEVITILILYQLSHSKTFKYFYKDIVLGEMLSFFPNAPSYNHFISLMPRVFFELMCYVSHLGKKNKTGVYYADSKVIKVCHNLRQFNHKVFKGLATKGKSSTGWFFGFKLHLVVNTFGEIVKFAFTPGNVADNNFEMMTRFFADLKGKIFADRGYISSKAFKDLFAKGVTVITKVRSNMKNRLMDYHDRLVLQKRGIIESIFNLLMTIGNIEHTRHRSPANAFTHMMAALAGYNYYQRKPKYNINNSISGR